MIKSSQDNGYPPSKQPGADMENKRRAFLKALEGTGISAGWALGLWQQVDQQAEPEVLIRQAIEAMYRENSEAVYDEDPPKVSSSDHKAQASPDGQSPPVTPKQKPTHGDFEVPPSSDSTDWANVIDLTPHELERWGGFLSEVDETDMYEEDDPPTDNFPLDVLPPAIKAPAEETMRRLRIAALLPVACLLAVISVALGRGLKVLSNKGWTYPNIFVLMGASSGTGKTFVYDVAMKPLNEMQNRLVETATDIKADLSAELRLTETSINALQRNYKKGEEKEVDRPEAERQNAKKKLAALCREKTELEDKLSHAFRIFTSDFTAEALGALLQHNNEVIGACSDEATIQLDNLLGRYNEGKITDDALLCKCYSVNAHSIDRIGRGHILLKTPCVALLFLCQPDTFQKAFSNERLLMGGFLARCLAADTRLQMQEEDEESEKPFDPEIEAEWDKFITGLFDKFHGANDPYILEVDPGVRRLSRALHNRIVRHVRTQLSDAQSFAVRWVEQTWKLAQQLHAALHGPDCDKHILIPETFQTATLLSDYFAATQMEALRNVRAYNQDTVHSRLQELFLEYGGKPITMRKLTKRHKLPRASILSCVKSHPETYGIVTKRSPRGGKPSTLVYLQKGEKS
jgi:hypothetical protein